RDRHVQADHFALRHHDQKAGGWIRRGRDIYADYFLSGFGRDFRVIVSGDETDGVLAGAGELHEHDLFERGFVGGGEGFVDLFDGGVDFVEQWNLQKQVVHEL